MTRQTSRLLRSPYSPTILSSESLSLSRQHSPRLEQRQARAFSGRRRRTNVRPQKLFAISDHSGGQSLRSLLTTTRDLVGLAVGSGSHISRYDLFWMMLLTKMGRQLWADLKIRLIFGKTEPSERPLVCLRFNVEASTLQHSQRPQQWVTPQVSVPVHE